MTKTGYKLSIALPSFFIAFVLCFVTVYGAYGQYSADPYEYIYRDISLWESKGYLKHVPHFRPLPEVVLIDLMERMLEKGSLADKQRAQYYLERLDSTFHFFTDLNFAQKSEFTPHNNPLGLIGNLYFGGSAYYKLFSISGGFSGNALLTNPYDNRDTYRNIYYSKYLLNKREEISDLNAFKIEDIDLGLSFGVRSALSLGTKNLFFHGGLMRRSIGPFFDDGVIVSSRAKLSPNFMVHWRGENLAATWGVFNLTARSQFSQFDNGERDKDTGEFIRLPEFTKSYDVRLNKYFFYHSLSFFLGENFDFHVFEGHMTGEVTLANLLPMKVMYQLGSFSNYGDYSGNTYLGIASTLRFLDILTIPIVLYVDDVNVEDLAQFDFDTKIKLAAQVGLKWAPRVSTLQFLSLDYQIVLPYTYTHNGVSGLYTTQFNTENYLHFNQPFATSLLPSSHRFTFAFELLPLSFLTLGGMTRFIQHNNPSDGILSGPLNNGGFLDDGYYSVYDKNSGPSYQNRNGFLENTVETQLELGLSLKIFYPINKLLTVYGDVAYTYSFAYNYQRTPDLTHQKHILLYSLGLRLTR